MSGRGAAVKSTELISREQPVKFPIRPGEGQKLVCEIW